MQRVTTKTPIASYPQWLEDIKKEYFAVVNEKECAEKRIFGKERFAELEKKYKALSDSYASIKDIYSKDLKSHNYAEIAPSIEKITAFQNAIQIFKIDIQDNTQYKKLMSESKMYQNLSLVNNESDAYEMQRAGFYFSQSRLHNEFATLDAVRVYLKAPCDMMRTQGGIWSTAEKSFLDDLIAATSLDEILLAAYNYSRCLETAITINEYLAEIILETLFNVIPEKLTGLEHVRNKDKKLNGSNYFINVQKALADRTANIRDLLNQTPETFADSIVSIFKNNTQMFQDIKLAEISTTIKKLESIKKSGSFLNDRAVAVDERRFLLEDYVKTHCEYLIGQFGARKESLKVITSAYADVVLIKSFVCTHMKHELNNPQAQRAIDIHAYDKMASSLSNTFFEIANSSLSNKLILQDGPKCIDIFSSVARFYENTVDNADFEEKYRKLVKLFIGKMNATPALINKLKESTQAVSDKTKSSKLLSIITEVLPENKNHDTNDSNLKKQNADAPKIADVLKLEPQQCDEWRAYISGVIDVFDGLRSTDEHEKYLPASIIYYPGIIYSELFGLRGSLETASSSSKNFIKKLEHILNTINNLKDNPENKGKIVQIKKLINLFESILDAVKKNESPGVNCRDQLNTFWFAKKLAIVEKTFFTLSDAIHSQKSYIGAESSTYIFGQNRFEKLYQEFEVLSSAHQRLKRNCPWTLNSENGIVTDAMKDELDQFLEKLFEIMESESHITLAREIKTYARCNYLSPGYRSSIRAKFYFKNPSLHNESATIDAIKTYLDAELKHAVAKADIAGVALNQFLNALKNAKSLDEIFLSVYEYMASEKNFNYEKIVMDAFSQHIPTSLTNMVLPKINEVKKEDVLQALKSRIGHIKRFVTVVDNKVQLSFADEKALVKQWSTLIKYLLNNLQQNEIESFGSLHELQLKIDAVAQSENYNTLHNFVSELAGKVKTKNIKKLLFKKILPQMRLASADPELLATLHGKIDDVFAKRANFIYRLNELDTTYKNLIRECEAMNDKAFNKFLIEMKGSLYFIKNESEILFLMKDRVANGSFEDVIRITDKTKELKGQIESLANSKAMQLWRAIEKNKKKVSNASSLSAEKLCAVAYFQIPAVDRDEAVTLEMVRQYFIKEIAHSAIVDAISEGTDKKLKNNLLFDFNNATTIDELLVVIHDLLSLQHDQDLIKRVLDTVNSLPKEETKIGIHSFREAVVQSLRNKCINTPRRVLVDGQYVKLSISDEINLRKKWQGAISILMENLKDDSFIKPGWFAKYSLQDMRNNLNQAMMNANTLDELSNALKKIKSSCSSAHAKSIVDEILDFLNKGTLPNEYILEKINAPTPVAAMINKINQLNMAVEKLKMEFTSWGRGDGAVWFLVSNKDIFNSILESPDSNEIHGMGYRVQNQLESLNKAMVELSMQAKNLSAGDEKQFKKVNELIGKIEASCKEVAGSNDVKEIRNQYETKKKSEKDEQKKIEQAIDDNVKLAGELFTQAKQLHEQSKVKGEKEVLFTEEELVKLVEIKSYAEKIQANGHGGIPYDKAATQLQIYKVQLENLAEFAKINAEEWNKYLVMGDAYLSDIDLLSPKKMSIDLVQGISTYKKLVVQPLFARDDMASALGELDRLSQKLKTLPDLPATPATFNVKKVANAVSVTEVHASLYSSKGKASSEVQPKIELGLDEKKQNQVAILN